LGGLGVALAAVAPSYALTFAAVVLSGIGVAAFHPEGSRFANYVSGSRRSSGMSLFSVGATSGSHWARRWSPRSSWPSACPERCSSSCRRR
ncbi:MAG: hypothetical protein ACXVVK_09485, partial [Solirubrobacteraceae bacterium]